MYTYRQLEENIFQSFSRSMVSVVLGPRRVGKSTLVEHYKELHSGNLWCKLNFDSRSIREQIRNQQLEQIIIEQVKQHIGKGQKIWVAIDEAQKCPEVFEQIKIIYDKHKNTDSIKFILTGSGYLSLHQLSAESLAGRIELYYLYQFNLRELGGLAAKNFPYHNLLQKIYSATSDILPSVLQEEYSRVTPFRQQQISLLESYLVWGGLPELYTLNHDKKSKDIYLSNYIDTYLEKDIRAIESITDLQLYKNLMEILAETTGSLRDEQKLIDSLQCSRETLKKYRGYLQATLLYRDLAPFISSIYKRIVKSPKTYLVDNGLISNLTGINNLNILQKGGVIGHRFENWFLHEIQTSLADIATRSNIYFWRLSSGVEVDFIVECKPRIFAFEVTYSSKKDSRKLANINKFKQDKSTNEWSFYVYNGDFELDEVNRIAYLPAWMI